MKIYTAVPSDLPPTALAIGTFDGFHLGHQALVRALKKEGSHTTIFTFSNHPLEIIKPDKSPKLLISLPEKINLIEQFQVDALIAIPFTKEIASLSYEEFLSPFSLTHLFLGQGDAFGKNREGHPENLLRLAKKRNFKLTVVDKTLFNGEPISSSRIRAAITSNDFELASQLLGRPRFKETHV